MQTTPLRADQLAHMLERLDQDSKAFASVYRGPRSEEARMEARQTLGVSVEKAQHLLQRSHGVGDPTLRGLRAELVVQSELAADLLKHPELLRR